MKTGYLRVASAVPPMNVADCGFNTRSIIAVSDELAAKKVKVAVFPEMSVTGYTCADLFHSSLLLESVHGCLAEIAAASERWDMLAIVGAPVSDNGALYNCAVVIGGGRVIAAVPKTYIPNYNEFYEKRWWVSGHGIDREVTIGGYVVPMSCNLMVDVCGVKIGMEICEDLWAVIPPSSRLSMAGAHVIFNLSASNDLIGKYDYLTGLVKRQSAGCISGYVYSGAGYGESSTDLVFDGKAIIAENGRVLEAKERWDNGCHYVVADIDVEAIVRDRMHSGSFSDCAVNEVTSRYRVVDGGIAEDGSADDSLYRVVEPHPFVPADDNDVDNRCGEIINIQVAGLARRLDFTRTKSLVVGISGGLDSTLALLVAVRTFDRLGLDRKGIVGVTMPGFGTTGRTYNNAVTLMRSLGVSVREISIVPAVTGHFADIGHDASVHDVTYENAQARERTQLLMDIANQTGGMVLGTGDLSELALGWATYNGDHMSMYGVNAGIPKTLVKYLVKWFASRSADACERESLADIIDTPISPELIPADEQGNIRQRTEDLVGPYELHDFILYYLLRYGFGPHRIFFLACHAFAGVYDKDTIRHWMTVFFRRFFSQQFKRSCLPDGPKVGSVCLSPRGDWRMPSDASAALWIEQCGNL
ncbi:MAG: NAD(+) synthase [Muribaculaceae bacterium]|nr:NAD(+) synthase [Muribaculaceae bacterium]